MGSPCFQTPVFNDKEVADLVDRLREGPTAHVPAVGSAEDTAPELHAAPAGGALSLLRRPPTDDTPERQGRAIDQDRSGRMIRNQDLNRARRGTWCFLDEVTGVSAALRVTPMPFRHRDQAHGKTLTLGTSDANVLSKR